MNQERVFKVLLGPHVSEKATVLAEKKASSYSRLLLMQPSWKSRKLSKACST